MCGFRAKRLHGNQDGLHNSQCETIASPNGKRIHETLIEPYLRMGWSLGIHLVDVVMCFDVVVWKTTVRIRELQLLENLATSKRHQSRRNPSG